MDVVLREEVSPEDREKVRTIMRSNSGFFDPCEIRVLLDLLEERLARQSASGYNFIFLEVSGQILGFTCFGPVPCTRSSYELYWIAVQRFDQHKGYGHLLLETTESRVSEWGGSRIYIDTSGRKEYESTQNFYRDCNYSLEAVLKDFYGAGDDKYIYRKVLNTVQL